MLRSVCYTGSYLLELGDLEDLEDLMKCLTAIMMVIVSEAHERGAYYEQYPPNCWYHKLSL